MTSVRTLIVDDSGFFRRRIREVLEGDSGIEVVGEAVNGRDAVDAVRRLRPDVVTMDIEMPEMDGISAVREIMRRNPTPVVMFSSLTYDGARATLDALDAGALDFLPKRFSDIAGDAEEAKRLLREKVRLVGRGGAMRNRRPAPSAAPGRGPEASAGADEAPSSSAPARTVETGLPPGRVRVVCIGTSTGGPVALQKVLIGLPARFPYPLLLVQHMPGSFTPAFATRLNQLCAIEVREARDGDRLAPGVALLAPGGRQMGLQRTGGQVAVRVFDAEEKLFYKPSVDITFAECARHFPGKVLGVVLTGMGSDGREGARELKAGGSLLWAQDEASSVIYGMPGAVAKAGLTDRILALDSVGPALARLH